MSGPDFELLFEIAPAAMAVLQVDGRILRSNSAFQSIARRGAAELHGSGLHFLTGIAALAESQGDALLHHGAENGRTAVRYHLNRLGPDWLLTLHPRSLADMRSHYRLVLDRIQEGICVIDADLKVRKANRAAQEMFEWTGGDECCEDFTKAASRTLNPDGTPLPPDRHPVSRALSDGKPQINLLVGLQCGEIVRRLQISALPVLHPDVGPSVIASFTDVADLLDARDMAALSEQRFRAIFDQTFQFIGLLEPDGTLIEANAPSLSFIGARIEDLRGKHFADTPWWNHSAEQQSQLRDAVARAAAGEFVRFEAIHPGLDGAELNIDFSLRPVRDESGKVVYLIPEGRDVTARKTLENQLRSERDQALAALKERE